MPGFNLAVLSMMNLGAERRRREWAPSQTHMASNKVTSEDGSAPALPGPSYSRSPFVFLHIMGRYLTTSCICNVGGPAKDSGSSGVEHASGKSSLEYVLVAEGPTPCKVDLPSSSRDSIRIDHPSLLDLLSS